MTKIGWSTDSPMVMAFMDACNKTGASFDDINMALILTIAEVCAHHVPSENRQDAYFNWLLGGVELVLKQHGLRKTARPNPMADAGARQ